MPSSKHQFCVVLSKTSHPGNIGACARAMKTMGITDLRLVQTVSEKDPVAYARSSGAEDVIFNAKHFNSLSDAISDSHVVFGTSGRVRSHVSPPLLLADQLPSHLEKNYTNSQKIALIFGNEKNGLDNDDLSLCHYQVTVPTSDHFKSLNLASCVQLICYLVFSQQSVPSDSASHTEGAAHAQIHALNAKISSLAFHKDAKKSQIDAQKLLQILLRLSLSSDEVNFLHGIFNRISSRDSNAEQ